MMGNGEISMDDYPDGYMEQEEEWEREGLLDPAWEKQQKKVSRIFFYFFLCNRKKKKKNESEINK